jgi:hypothetical protein
MPQVKFSGLVTDMKGKAGGSVFSSNKQGAYMRNNKWGGGRKSQRWDASKSKLASLANTWKSLNPNEQQAWNDAAADYPFTNKFGEQYIGSGYQVYMSLNGTLSINALPLLREPGARRAFPDDMFITFRNPDLPWVTSGTGTTVPYVPYNGCTEEDPPPEGCADCEDCFNGDCWIVGGSKDSQEYLDCKGKIKNMFFQFEPVECTSDSDCVDAGLSGASADVSCENGECVYVGDGLMNWSSLGYVLNVYGTLADDGEWNEDTPEADAQLNGSFRVTLGPNILKSLQTTDHEIVLLSNYYADGRGLTIRLRPQDQTTTRIFFTYGIGQNLEAPNNATYVFYQDILNEFFTPGTVIQYSINLVDTYQTVVSVGRTGFLNMQTETYLGLKTGKISTWGAPYSDQFNPFASWYTLEKWYGLVFGSGIQGKHQDAVYSDIRIYNGRVSDFLKPLVGYLNGVESVVILANGLAAPKCNYKSCNYDLVGCCKPEATCTCGHSVCGTWGQRDDHYRNAAPGGDTNIFLSPSVPVFNIISNEPTVKEFAGYWMQMDGGSFGNMGATYVPNVYIDIEAGKESGFVLQISVTRAKSYNTNQRWSPEVYATTLSVNINETLNLWEFIKDAIGNALPGTSFEVGYRIVDSNTGLATAVGRTRPRFKAGAELSSSVN